MQDLNTNIDIIDLYISELVSLGEYDAAIKKLNSLHPADLADFLDRSIYTDKNLNLLPQLLTNIENETLIYINSNTLEYLVEVLGNKKIAEMISELDSNDIIDILSNLKNSIKVEIIRFLSSTTKQNIQELLSYLDDTAGRVMDKNFVSIDESWTVLQTLKYLANLHILKDIYILIVINKNNIPIGTINPIQLIQNKKSTLLAEIAKTDIKIVNTSTNLNDVAYYIKQYSSDVLPVVNKFGKLVGSINIENMIDIITEQTEEELMNLTRTHDINTFSNTYQTIKGRFPWVLINLLSACLNSLIINKFADIISQIVTIAAIMPIIAAIAGTSGSQVMTVTVRAISNKDILGNKIILKFISKEILVALGNGFMLSIIGFCIIYVIYQDAMLASVFGIAIILNFVVAGGAGSSIPIMMNRIGIDPASASVVILTALTDAFSFFSFLFISNILLL